MARFAAGKIAAAQSIFKGHAISVKFIGPNEEYPVFILTFKVTEWIKGSRQPYARVIYESWCDGGCPNIPEEEDKILEAHREKIYIADHPKAELLQVRPIPESVDGIFSLCGHFGRKVEPVSQTHISSPVWHTWFLFDLAMRQEIEGLLPQRNSIP
jgi:hypothetical protein